MCSSWVRHVTYFHFIYLHANQFAAEFRGPGVHHNFDDSDSGYDVDMDNKIKSFGGNKRGRIILLGDGSEVLTDSDDTEMFDHGEEDKDLASQVTKVKSVSEPAGDSTVIPDKIDASDPKVKAVADKVTLEKSDKWALLTFSYFNDIDKCYGRLPFWLNVTTCYGRIENPVHTFFRLENYQDHVSLLACTTKIAFLWFHDLAKQRSWDMDNERFLALGVNLVSHCVGVSFFMPIFLILRSSSRSELFLCLFFSHDRSHNGIGFLE